MSNNELTDVELELLLAKNLDSCGVRKPTKVAEILLAGYEVKKWYELPITQKKIDRLNEWIGMHNELLDLEEGSSGPVYFAEIKNNVLLINVHFREFRITCYDFVTKEKFTHNIHTGKIIPLKPENVSKLEFRFFIET